MKTRDANANANDDAIHSQATATKETPQNPPPSPPPPSEVQLHLISSRSKSNNIHTSLFSPLTQDDHLVISISDFPDLFARFADLPYELARIEIPQLDSSIISACDDVSVVKL